MLKCHQEKIFKLLLLIPQHDSKDETKDEKMPPLDLKNALEIDPYGIKLVDKLQKYGFFKQEDFQEIARKMSEEGIRNVLMAYSKLLLKIPGSFIKKSSKTNATSNG